MPEIHYIKLSDLSKKIESVIKQHFGSETYWIVAEISSHKFYPNQDRHYFDFVEKIENSTTEAAKIKGIAWSNSSQSIKNFETQTGQKFTNGIQILAKVKVEYHVAYGFSLILQDIDLSFTLGNLEKQRQATLQKLLIENPTYISLVDGQYITRNKKISLNKVIQNIALIASPNSEGYTDFTHTINSNRFNYKFKIETYYSSVQGTEAATELAKTFLTIFNSKKSYDAVVIIRGGGAKTDFLVFDSYNLTRIIARFPIPVITGIGHHKDVSVADLMCHTTTKTPTKSAEFIISHNRAFEDSLTQSLNQIIVKSQQMLRFQFNQTNALYFNISNTVTNLISKHKETMIKSYRMITMKSLDSIYIQNGIISNIANRITSKPLIQVNHAQNNLSNLILNFQVFSKKLLINKRGYLGHLVSVINLMSPKSIMKRGFAIVSLGDKIVKDASEISVGSKIKISFSEDELNSQVISKSKSNGDKFEV